MRLCVCVFHLQNLNILQRVQFTDDLFEMIWKKNERKSVNYFKFRYVVFWINLGKKKMLIFLNDLFLSLSLLYHSILSYVCPFHFALPNQFSHSAIRFISVALRSVYITELLSKVCTNFLTVWVKGADPYVSSTGIVICFSSVASTLLSNGGIFCCSPTQIVTNNRFNEHH